MKKIITILSVCLSLKYYSQTPKGSYQAGISVLPITDFFNFFPDNAIKGVAVSVNAGNFIFPDFVFGLNPYYATVSNSYESSLPSGATITEEDHIQLYGLNAYMRYYLVNGQKWSFYLMLAGGFGNQQQQKVSTQQPAIHTSILTFMPGVGINYRIADQVALELNVPYIKVNETGTKWEDFLFHSVAPTIGVQFSWQ